jgi:hypothetical protein
MLYSRSKGPSAEPVTNEEYAIQIGRDWNVKESGSGFVTRFFVRKAFIADVPKVVKRPRRRYERNSSTLAHPTLC